MTVQQIIDRLNEIDDKSQSVYYLDDYGEKYNLVKEIDFADEDSDNPKLIII